jgi:hypothetical protein
MTGSRAPLFSFYGGGVGFDSRWFDLAREGYGSASGFVSQESLAPLNP